MEISVRLFNCGRCHCQVIICNCCDHGNIYCGSSCSKSARRESVRNAGKRYQNSRRGKMKHAQRQSAYQKANCKKMTHQGSIPFTGNDLLVVKPINPTTKQDTRGICCHFCSKCCSGCPRLGFLNKHPGNEGKNEFRRRNLLL